MYFYKMVAVVGHRYFSIVDGKTEFVDGIEHVQNFVTATSPAELAHELRHVQILHATEDSARNEVFPSDAVLKSCPRALLQFVVESNFQILPAPYTPEDVISRLRSPSIYSLLHPCPHISAMVAHTNTNGGSKGKSSQVLPSRAADSSLAPGIHATLGWTPSSIINSRASVEFDDKRKKRRQGKGQPKETTTMVTVLDSTRLPYYTATVVKHPTDASAVNSTIASDASFPGALARGVAAQLEGQADGESNVARSSGAGLWTRAAYVFAR
jgi:hypothetical protein